MADVATLSATTTATPGPFWAEFTNAANIVLNASGTNSGVTAITVGIPSSPPFSGATAFINNANIPFTVIALNQTNIQGAKSTGLPAGAGIANVVWTNSVDFTVNIVNAAASSNVASGTRWLMFMGAGV